MGKLAVMKSHDLTNGPFAARPKTAALEAERAKYARIKSGMMQQLLTGKTRLEHDRRS